jgi:hypothetical protein
VCLLFLVLRLKDKKQILNSLHTLKNRQLLIQACVYTDLESSDFVYFFNDKKRSKSCSQVPPAKSKYEFRSDEVSG